LKRPDQKLAILSAEIVPGKDHDLSSPLTMYIRLTQANTGVEFELRWQSEVLQEYSLYSVINDQRSTKPLDTQKDSILRRGQPWSLSVLVVGRLVIWRDSSNQILEPLPVMAGLLPGDSAGTPVLPAFGVVTQDALIFQKLDALFVPSGGN
jgi:hypothetical protein